MRASSKICSFALRPWLLPELSVIGKPIWRASVPGCLSPRDVTVGASPGVTSSQVTVTPGITAAPAAPGILFTVIPG